jgi:orotate phosphoribosyltransferase-like protein
MSAADRRESIAKAKKLQARGLTVGEIAKALSVLPEIIDGWLRELPRS